MHLAMIGPDMTGHLNPMTTLGRALLRRGHRVSLVGLPESQPKAEAAGLQFLPIGRSEHAAGLLEAGRAKLGRLRGIAALRFTGHLLRGGAAIVLRDLPAAVLSAGVDALVVDQITPAGSVAELLGLPFVVVCNALALHQEPSVPPPVLGWSPSVGVTGRLRNRIGNLLLRTAARPVREEVARFRRRHRLAAYRYWNLENDGLAQVSQQPAFFDFPRERLPDHFHFTGPWHAQGRDVMDFPWHRLDGRPLVYASLGTLQNRLRPLFAAIAAACAGAEVQLVASLGRPEADANLGIRWPPGTVVVPYAPQLELLKRSAAVITHAGLNTTLETLACGVPMVAIPLTNDQPGVARRAAWLGAAEVVPANRADGRSLRVALRRVLRESEFRAAARHCGELLRKSPGPEKAAAIAETALLRRNRLTRDDVSRLIPVATESEQRDGR